MSEQPEPASGYAVGPDGVPYAKGFDGWWRGVDGRARFADLGEATPLLPAVRPDGVPDDAVPFVGWVGWFNKDLCAWSPNGTGPTVISVEEAESWDYPVPAAPAPSLPERLRAEADALRSRSSRDLSLSALVHAASEAADALEAGSQP